MKNTSTSIRLWANYKSQCTKDVIQMANEHVSKLSKSLENMTADVNKTMIGHFTHIRLKVEGWVMLRMDEEKGTCRTGGSGE